MHKNLERYGYMLSLLLISAFITAAGYGFVQQQKQIVIKEARLDLATIVDLKVSQITQWRKERLLEATSIYSNTMIAHRIKEYLHDRENEAAIKEIQGWMARLERASGYSNVFLFSPNGDVLISSSPISTDLTVDRRLLNSVLQKKEVVLSDLHVHEGGGEFDINLFIPVIDPESSTSECIAIFAIDINPLIHLYPLLRSRPTPSRTGENLLVRHDGDNVLYLNELRFRDDSALTLHQPLTLKNSPAVRAALGQEGVFEGLDYRGVDVIAAVRSIPGSPWAMVCKLDTLEVLEPVSQRIQYVVGTCLLIVLATSLALSLRWRRKREAYLSRLYESELNFNRELKRAEQSLQEANNRLEERVALRTEELSESNEKLRQEITERKQVEEVLRKHFKAIQQSPIAIVITDLSGTIEFVNPKFTEYSGYSHEEAIGQTLRILRADVTPPEVHTQLWETIRSGKIWEGDFCNRNKRGELYWEHDKILPIKNLDGMITNYMAFNEDITKQRLLEENLFQSRRLETIGQIAGGVAHEVRNPLNAILSISEALFREKEFDNNPEFTPYIQHIRTQVNRLANLMNDLLDLGKTISPANFQAVSLLGLCREALELWRVSGMAENREVIIQADQDEAGPVVQADSGKLQQVIFNLLENAGHHNPAGNVITLRLGESAETDGMAFVQISDLGKGIPEENLARVFEPFYSNRKGGTGLGLPLVRHFITNMGGSVRIWNNEPPPGCTAELLIPLAAKEHA